MLGLIIALLVIALVIMLIYRFILDKIRYLEIQSYKKKCLENYYPLPLFPPTVLTDRYDVNLAKYLLGLSLNVELSNCKSLGSLAVPAGFISKKIDGDVLGTKRMLAYVYTSSKAIIIVFSGTVFADEWNEDMEVSQVPISLDGSKGGEKAHEGFYKMYSSLRIELLDYVKKMHLEQKVYITGHSLGGGLSILAAFDLNKYQPIVYTFAGPRVFNIDGAKRYDSIVTYTYRIHNTEDIFTSLPLPVAFGTDYEHVGDGGIPFTINLGSMALNHTDAYVKHFS